ncbi:MAG: hypothetical protein KJO88_11230 [Gammaproteobacteria bacterium]|nr:hypothetical protein [Gammaproteobacteria bacterium]
MQNGNTRLKFFLGLLISGLLLLGCQHAPASMSGPQNIDIEFELPADKSQPPKRVKGPESAMVDPGDTLNFSVKPGSGAMLLIVLESQSPFVSGDFTVKLSPGAGNNKSLAIATDRKGTYKYILVDVSGNPNADQRPPLDPYIVVKK